MFNSFRSAICHLAPLVALMLVTGTGLAWAQCDPGCDNCASKGDRLKCKFDALADEGNALIDNLKDGPLSELLTPAAVSGLNKSKERLVTERGRLRADDFRLLAKKRDTSCQTVEAMGDGDGNDDGACDAGERCAEAIGDGIGNDDGICWPVNGNRREVCAQICDEEAVLQDEANVDDDLATELEDVYDDMTGQARDMNTSLLEVATFMPTIKASVFQADLCSIDTAGLTRTNFLLYVLAKTASVAARGGADIAERACDQQVMMNCAACCAPAEGIAGAFEAGWTAIAIVESTINSATIDAALACVAKLKSSAGENTADLNLIEQALLEMEREQNTIIELLTTPQGQRPGFPIPPQ